MVEKKNWLEVHHGARKFIYGVITTGVVAGAAFAVGNTDLLIMDFPTYGGIIMIGSSILTVLINNWKHKK